MWGADRNASPDPTASPTPSTAAAATFEFAVDNRAVGPAPAVAGAVRGGTVHVLDLDDVAHLDPARNYVGTYMEVSQLILRTLTGFRQQEGRVSLVGDLATDTGRTDDGGKTWTYTLRDGIRYEDGSPILAGDVKYGIERGFVSDYSEGPTYIQEWLADTIDFRKAYQGPYGGKSLAAVAAPDDKTVVFTFAKAHPDLPFALALPIGGPVKKSEDTKAKYDLKPFASGPYKIKEHKVDKSLLLAERGVGPRHRPDPPPVRGLVLLRVRPPVSDDQPATHRGPWPRRHRRPALRQRLPGTAAHGRVDAGPGRPDGARLHAAGPELQHQHEAGQRRRGPQGPPVRLPQGGGTTSTRRRRS